MNLLAPGLLDAVMHQLHQRIPDSRR
jgi:hypothetical protein